MLEQKLDCRAESDDAWRDWPLILAYHSVSDRRRDSLAVSISDFEYQMNWLNRKGYRSVTLAEFNQTRPEKGEKIVIITFDDGYEDNFLYAYPVLKRYGFSSTVFLVSDYIGTDHIYWWDKEKISKDADRELYRIVDLDQIQEMSEDGFEFGSHTLTHPRLTEVSDSKSWEEISQSKENLESKIGIEVVSFCYPHGNLEDKHIRMVERAGYITAVVTPPRGGIPLNKYTLRRVGVYYHNKPFQFRLKTRPIVRRNLESRMARRFLSRSMSLISKR